MNDIREKDWKVLRSMKDGVLNRACGRTLEKVSKTIKDDTHSNHAKYLELWKIMKEDDDQIARMFDDFKRSSALQQPTLWKFNNLIEDSDMGLFTEDTQERVSSLLTLLR